MTLALTGTTYITNTDDLISVADERLIIEAADDSKAPQTTAASFDELQAAAVLGGAGSDAEKVRDQVMLVLSKTAKEAENEVEGFGRGIYNIPYNPVDGYVKNLALDYFWWMLRKRRNMFRGTEKTDEERSLRARGQLIRGQDYILSSDVLEQGTGAEEMVFDYGSADRTAYRDPVVVVRRPWKL